MGGWQENMGWNEIILGFAISQEQLRYTAAFRRRPHLREREKRIREGLGWIGKG